MIKKKFGRKDSFYNQSFSSRVLTLALAIPKGKVTTYGSLARAAGGGSMAAQSITRVLGKAYDLGETTIPFHRIVYANGQVWLDNEHKVERMKKYDEEGIKLDKKNRIVDFEEKSFDLARVKFKNQ